MPLISPQSTLPDNNRETLAPPPGFTKPFQPMNYAAMMDENLQSRGSCTTEYLPGLNFCNLNMTNDNLLASANALYNPSALALPPEALIQFWKQKLEMDIYLAAAVNQFLLSNNLATTAVNSTLNLTKMEPPCPSVEKPEVNPSQSYKDQLSTTMNSYGGSTNYSQNLSTSEFNTCNFLSSTTLPQTETKRNLISKDSDILDFDQKILRGGTDGDVEELVQRLHDTNPFKQHIIGGASSPIETSNNTLKVPPIPPRNPDSINKSSSLTTNHLPDAYRSPKIYYSGEPVMYNLKTTNTDNKRGEESFKSTDSVSFGNNKPNDIVNSTQDTTNHLLGNNTLLDFGRINSLEVRNQDSFTPALDHNIFTPVGKISADDTQCFSPRTLLNSYRPPPPPYNGNSYTECQYKNKSPISPRYPSPLVSDHSKTVIEDIPLTLLNFLEKLESAATENSGLITRDEKLGGLGASEKHGSSSSTTNNVTSSSSTTQPKKSYKIKLNIPKTLQGQQSSINLKQEQPDNLQQTNVLSETLDITLRFGETEDFNKQKQSSSTTNQNDQTSPWSIRNRESQNLHGNVPTDSGEPRGHSNPFIQAVEKDDIRNRKEFSSPIQTLGSQPTLVNQWPIPETKRGNSRNGEITKDIDHLRFSTTTKPMHDSPISSTHPYQSQRPNAPHYYQPFYPHPGPLLPHQNYPYQMPPELIPRPPFHPRMQLFSPNMHGYYAPPPPWIKPQLFNAAYSHASAHASQPRLHPNFWSHNPMFAPKHTADVSHRADAPHSKSNLKTESFLSETDHAHIVRLEFRNKQMGVDQSDLTPSTHGSTGSIVPQLNGLDLYSANGTEKSGEEDSLTVESNDGRTLAVEGSTLSSSKESMDKILNGFSEEVATRVVNVFKPVEVKCQTIFLFNIESEGWVSTDELVEVFIPSETRNAILRMLNAMNVKIDFKEITRAQSPDLFNQLDDTSLRLPRMTHSRRIRGVLHLTPIRSLSQMMIALRVISNEDIGRSILQKKPPPGSNLAELVKLVAAYRSNDDYWA